MNNIVADFFDSMAASWDVKNNIDESIINTILDYAGVAGGMTVLDAGCGTGVLIPFFLERGVKSVTAVDISKEMTDIGKLKFPQKNVSFVCGGIESYRGGEPFDCVIAHNSFPHFLMQDMAINNLKRLTRPGGRLTVAHSISREAVLRCHRNMSSVSLELPETAALAAMLRPEFDIEREISDSKMYLVSGIKGVQ